MSTSTPPQSPPPDDGGERRRSRAASDASDIWFECTRADSTAEHGGAAAPSRDSFSEMASPWASPRASPVASPGPASAATNSPRSRPSDLGSEGSLLLGDATDGDFGAAPETNETDITLALGDAATVSGGYVLYTFYLGRGHHSWRARLRYVRRADLPLTHRGDAAAATSKFGSRRGAPQVLRGRADLLALRARRGGRPEEVARRPETPSRRVAVRSVPLAAAPGRRGRRRKEAAAAAASKDLANEARRPDRGPARVRLSAVPRARRRADRDVGAPGDEGIVRGGGVHVRRDARRVVQRGLVRRRRRAALGRREAAVLRPSGIDARWSWFFYGLGDDVVRMPTLQH